MPQGRPWRSAETTGGSWRVMRLARTYRRIRVIGSLPATARRISLRSPSFRLCVHGLHGNLSRSLEVSFQVRTVQRDGSLGRLFVGRRQQTSLSCSVPPMRTTWLVFCRFLIKRYDTILDISALKDCFAVGLARSSPPTTRVLGFDTNPCGAPHMRPDGRAEWRIAERVSVDGGCGIIESLTRILSAQAAVHLPSLIVKVGNSNFCRPDLIPKCKSHRHVG